jgi:hypothetical protein
MCIIAQMSKYLKHILGTVVIASIAGATIGESAEGLLDVIANTGVKAAAIGCIEAGEPVGITVSRGR